MAAKIKAQELLSWVSNQTSQACWYSYILSVVIILRFCYTLGKRKTRCFRCSGCLAKDCGHCKHCLDKPKYGGKGTLKQCCLKRKCTEIHSTTNGMHYYSYIRQSINQWSITATDLAANQKQRSSDSGEACDSTISKVRMNILLITKDCYHNACP